MKEPDGRGLRERGTAHGWLALCLLEACGSSARSTAPDDAAVPADSVAAAGPDATTESGARDGRPPADLVPGDSVAGAGSDAARTDAATVAACPASTGVEAPSPEPSCPGGASPHPDTLFCDDFETTKWIGATGGISVSPERPFMGRQSAKFRFGELGAPGFTDFSFRSQEELRVRFYILFNERFHWGHGTTDHVMAPLEPEGGTSCVGNTGGLDWGPTGPLIYRSGSCYGERHKDLPANLGSREDRMVRNGRWYRIEAHWKVNSIGGCSDKNKNGKIDSQGECDGVVEVWIDDKLVLGYYDVNYRGNDNPGFRLKTFLFNHYFRTGGQTYNGRDFAEYRDNLVVVGGASAARPIGPAKGEPSCRGAADPSSPYKTDIYKEWFAFNKDGNRIRPGADCAFSLFPDPNWFNVGGGGKADFVDSPAHNTTRSHCSSQVVNDRALRATTTSGNGYAGAGIDGIAWLPNETVVMNGSFQLDAAGFPAPKGTALAGFLKYAGRGRNYLAFGVNGASRPVLLQQTKQDSGSAPIVLASNDSVQMAPGVWYRLEVRAKKSGPLSVLLDGKEVLKATSPDAAAFFADPWSFHFGISDHLGNTSPMTVTFDDVSVGTTSFEDCFGWDAAFCPF